MQAKGCLRPEPAQAPCVSVPWSPVCPQGGVLRRPTWAGGPHLFADLPQDGGLEWHGLEERPHHTALLPRLQLIQLPYWHSTAWAQRVRAQRPGGLPGTPQASPSMTAEAWASARGGETTQSKDPLNLKGHMAAGQRESVWLGPEWVLM